MKRILIGLVIVALLTGCRIEKIKDNEKSNSFSTEYEVEKNNVFVEATADDVLNVFKKGTSIIYFGYPESEFCQEVVKILDDISKDYDIEEIYYLNMEELKEENNSKYQEIINVITPYLEKDESNNLILKLPDVYFIKDGKIVGNHISTNQNHEKLVQEQGKWVDLTDKEKEDLKNIFLGLLTQIYSCNFNCN